MSQEAVLTGLREMVETRKRSRLSTTAAGVNNGEQNDDDYDEKRQATKKAATTPPTTDPIDTANAKAKAGKAASPSKTAAVATVAAKPLPVPDDAVWKDTILNRIPLCTSAEGIQATSVYQKYGTSHHRHHHASTSGRNGCLRRLLQELAALEANLPNNPAIWVRFDEETPQFLRAVITAPTQTPYSLGLFCFDIFVPDQYPSLPPKMQLLTTGGGQVRFSPNLYADGKVCLSLLNTFSGPRWNPAHSTLLQCLVSLQGLILGVEHPYYLEPGHGGWEGHITETPKAVAAVAAAASASAAAIPGGAITAAIVASSVHPTTTTTTSTATVGIPPHIQQFEDRIRIGTAKYAMLDMIASVTTAGGNGGSNSTSSSHKYLYLQPFADIIRAHFHHCRDRIVQETREWSKTIRVSAFRRQLSHTIKQIETELVRLEPLLPAIITSMVAAPAEATNNNNNAEEKMDDSGNSKRLDTKVSAVESAINSKNRAMKEAAAQGDFVTAGRLQTELRHAEQFGSVESKIVDQRQQMEAAASKGDYITAGQFQISVQHLESNQKLLQDLQGRMLDAATKLDFLRAGRFQEQYKILLSCDGDSLANSKAAAQSMAASGGVTGAATTVAGGVLGAMMGMPHGLMGTMMPGQAAATEAYKVAQMKSMAAMHAASPAGQGDYDDVEDDDGYGDY